MPRPRSLRAPPLAATAGAAADEEEQILVPEEPAAPPQVRDPAQEQILRSLPNTFSREMKLAALGWRGGCFCCPANISFAQCISGLWYAARKPAESAEALIHWGLNASKFLFEAGPIKGSYGRNLLLRAGFPSLVSQLLPYCEEVPQSIMLTPQISFVQIFGTGARQLPLSTTPQLVALGLLALTALSPATLRATLAGGAPDNLIPSLVRALSSTTDDRLRSMVFQILTEWINVFDGDPLVEDDEKSEEEEEGGGRSRGGGGSAVEQDALIEALFDAGLALAVTHILESSSNAAVLRDTCAFLLALLAGGVGGGVAGRRAAPGGRSGGEHGAGGPPGPHGAMRVAGMTAMELAAEAALAGGARCRARTELLRAGLVPALLSALSRRPSQMRYWVAINLGVSGARHLEMQWLMLVIARMSILPEAASAQQESSEPAANGAAEASPGAAAAAAGTSESGGRGSRQSAAASGPKPRGRARRADPATAADEAERLRLAAAEQLVQSSLFNAWLESKQPPAGATASAALDAAGKPPVESSGAGAEAPATSGQADAESSAGGVAAEAAEAAAASSPSPPLPAAPLAVDARAVKLLSRVIAASTLRTCVLPAGAPLEALPPGERNATPDFRALQRDRIRRAAEEARAAQALASASAAVDVLSRAVASM